MAINKTIQSARLRGERQVDGVWLYWAEVRDPKTGTNHSIALTGTEYEVEIHRRNQQHTLRFETLKAKSVVSFEDALNFAVNAPLLSPESKTPLSDNAKPNNILRSARANRLLKVEYIEDHPEDYYALSADVMADWLRRNLCVSLDQTAVDTLIQDADDDESTTRVQSYETLEFVCARWLNRERVCSPEVHERSPSVLRLLNDVSTRSIFEPHDIGPQLRDWLADCLLGRIAKPSRRGKRKDQNHSRNGKIVWVVHELEAVGVAPTRNLASPPLSGIDAVGQAIAANWGINMGYKALETIWLNRSK